MEVYKAKIHHPSRVSGHTSLFLREVRPDELHSIATEYYLVLSTLPKDSVKRVLYILYFLLKERSRCIINHNQLSSTPPGIS